jgi:hypothetical protein
VGGVVGCGPGAVFKGSLERPEDVAAAAAQAAGCAVYRPDDEDEDYLDGARTCFGCRYRRWVVGGFSCLRGLLPVQAPAGE